MEFLALLWLLLAGAALIRYIRNPRRDEKEIEELEAEAEARVAVLNRELETAKAEFADAQATLVR